MVVVGAPSYPASAFHLSTLISTSLVGSARSAVPTPIVVKSDAVAVPLRDSRLFSQLTQKTQPNHDKNPARIFEDRTTWILPLQLYRRLIDSDILRSNVDCSFHHNSMA